MSDLRRTTLVTLTAALLVGCSAPDPFPGGADSPPPPVRPADGLLGDVALQAVVEATLARDGQALIQGLDDPDPIVRARAAYGLASVQDPRAIPALEARLADDDARVRADAAFALGQMPDGVRSALRRALASESDDAVRAALVEAVGKVGDPAALSALLAITDSAVLEPATLALSRGVIRGTHPAGALDTLVARLTHERPDVREAAAYFAARSDVDAWWGRRIDLRQALDGYALDDPAAMHLIRGLGQRMRVFSRPSVVRFLTASPDWRIRVNAVQALAAEEAVVPINGLRFVAALDDPSPHVREAAATAVAAAPPSAEVHAALLDWLDEHPDQPVVTTPLLPLLVRIGEEDRAVRRLRTIPARDGTGWQLAMTMFEIFQGEAAIHELGRLVARDDLPASVGRTAAAELAERWELARPMPSTHDAFLEVVGEAVADAPDDRLVILAPVLADPALRERGGRAVLEAELGRLGVEARDSVMRILDPGMAERGAVVGESDTGPTPPERLAVDWAFLGELGPSPRLVLETDKGTIVLRLLTESAPLTVQSMARLAMDGRHDGVPFHRVVPNFVIQGGDVGSADGSGGPGYRIRSELTRTPYLRGVLGMARTSALDTEGSQFFVTHSPQWHLDGGYTAFGWVERGMEVVDRITRGDRVLEARVIPIR